MLERKYYPTLRTREAELLALENLSESRKNSITPLLTFGKIRKNIAGEDQIFNAIRAAFGERDYILDLTHDKEHFDSELTYLKNPDDHYQAWRNLNAQNSVKIPCVIQSDLNRPRDFIRQALALENDHGSLAFRIRNLITEPALVINALNAVDDPKNCIVFIDAGYISNRYEHYVATTLNVIQQLQTAHPEIKISVLSSTFPQSVVNHSQDAQQTWGLVPLLEHDFHNATNETGLIIYGDHSSIHAAIYNERGGRGIPRIDYPRLEESYFERRPFDQGAAKPYTQAAQEIINNCPEIATQHNIWGVEQIAKASAGDLFARNPSSWIAVRVNIYLSRQIDYWNGVDPCQQKNFNQEFEDEDEFSDLF